MVDAADEVAFEAADRFGVGLAFGALLGDVLGGLGVVADAGEREHVEGVVELAAVGLEVAQRLLAQVPEGGDEDQGDEEDESLSG